METNKNRAQSRKKQINWLPIAAVAVLILTAAVVLFSEKSADPNGGGDSLSLQPEDTAAPTSGEDSPAGTGSEDSYQIIAPGESLVIDTSGITETAQFFPVEVDGIQMEVIAVRDSGGTVRTAFNTCQICYDSGRGYYVQEGDALVCQNCGNRFTVDHVEIQSGGCNPWPIFAENKTESENSISISYDYLQEAVQIFSNWKTSY